MSEKTPTDSHYARLRRRHRDANRTPDPDDGRVWLYGLHTVAAALGNPGRVIHRIVLSENARSRMNFEFDPSVEAKIEILMPRDIDGLVGGDAVHQGAALLVDPLPGLTLEDIWDAALVLVLDQVTDPHNVGALMRSAVAMGADALVTTQRHSPQESGVLAKAASGALEHLPLVTVRNLANALTELVNHRFEVVGLDSDADHDLEDAFSGARIAIVLGAEGKGLRQKTRSLVSRMAKLDMPGPIRSLNVSNAGALALYVARKHLKTLGSGA